MAKTGLTTSAFADSIGMRPDSIRVHLCKRGSFYGIKPVKMLNGRLMWPEDSTERMLGAQKAETETQNDLHLTAETQTEIPEPNGQYALVPDEQPDLYDFLDDMKELLGAFEAYWQNGERKGEFAHSFSSMVEWYGEFYSFSKCQMASEGISSQEDDLFQAMNDIRP